MTKFDSHNNIIVRNPCTDYYLNVIHKTYIMCHVESTINGLIINRRTLYHYSGIGKKNCASYFRPHRMFVAAARRRLLHRSSSHSINLPLSNLEFSWLKYYETSTNIINGRLFDLRTGQDIVVLLFRIECNDKWRPKERKKYYSKL